MIYKNLYKTLCEISKGVWVFRLNEAIQYLDDNGTGTSEHWLKIMKRQGWLNYTVSVANRKYITLEGLLRMLNYMNIPKREVVMSVYRDKTTPRVEISIKELEKLKKIALLDDNVKEFKKISLMIEQRKRSGKK